MEIGIVGLGKMGGNMARRLLREGHRVVGYNRSPEVTRKLAEEAGLVPAFSLEELVEQLAPPRAVWCMVPAGEPTEQMLHALAERLAPNDVLIDGGNSNFHDSMRRAAWLAEHGLHFLDVGVSGGVWGLTEGYALMIGGKAEVVERLRPIFETLAPAPDKGWGHVGPHGAGHFVKMVHNGIEYGIMEAYAEGFDLLRARQDFGLDLHQVAEIWRFGSVIRSWLLDLTAQALAEDPDLQSIRGWVADSGEGRWTVEEAIRLAVPVPVIADALFMRFASRLEERFADKVLAAMRHQFGGHAVKRADETA